MRTKKDDDMVEIHPGGCGKGDEPVRKVSRDELKPGPEEVSGSAAREEEQS